MATTNDPGLIKKLQDHYATTIQSYRMGQTFTAHDFIGRFKSRNEELYNGLLNQHGEQTLHQCIGRALLSYDGITPVEKLGVDAVENVSTWRRIR